MPSKKQRTKMNQSKKNELDRKTTCIISMDCVLCNDELRILTNPPHKSGDTPCCNSHLCNECLCGADRGNFDCVSFFIPPDDVVDDYDSWNDFRFLCPVCSKTTKLNVPRYKDFYGISGGAFWEHMCIYLREMCDRKKTEKRQTLLTDFLGARE